MHVALIMFLVISGRWRNNISFIYSTKGTFNMSSGLECPLRRTSISALLRDRPHTWELYRKDRNIQGMYADSRSYAAYVVQYSAIVSL